jgi:UDP-glucose 4-epimerase
MVGVVQSMGDPSLDRHVNVEGTSALLALCRRYGSPKFVFLSSGGAVYGETPVPATEATSPAPLSYYGVHKYCAEKYVEFSGLPYVSLRLANVYGPRQRAGLEGGAVAIFAERLQSGLPLEVFGSGEQVRDFVYVTDVAEAAVLAATTPVSGLWNIGTGTATSVNALWRQLGTLMGIVPEVRYHPPRQGEIIRSCLSIQRAIEDGWWRPRYGLEDGLRAMLKALGPPDR